MAKKKSSSSSGNGAAGRTPAKKPAAAKAVEFSTDLIGDTAGKVWHSLSSGPQTLAALKKSVDAPGEVVLTALGWLAREGKLSFETNGRSVKVSLR